MAADNKYINPTVKGVRWHPLAFVFPGKSMESAALVRSCSLVNAPTVAIRTPSMDGQVAFCLIEIGPLLKEALRKNDERPRLKHRAPKGVKEVATKAGQEVAEALRDLLVMIGAEATKREIWVFDTGLEPVMGGGSRGLDHRLPTPVRSRSAMV